MYSISVECLNVIVALGPARSEIDSTGYFASNGAFMTVDMGVWNVLADRPIYQKMRRLFDQNG